MIKLLTALTLPTLLAAMATGCAASKGPLAPDPTVTRTSPLPILLSGQSNALPDHLGGPLQTAYAPGVVNVSQGATAIRAWGPGGPLWAELEPQLHQPLTAFIWWQGESDAVEGGDHYAADLQNLIARVRAANANPRLLVVVVKIIPYAPGAPLHDTSLVRAAEEAFVASDPHSAIVRVDDLPSDGGNHLLPPAYPTVASRVVDIVGSGR